MHCRLTPSLLVVCLLAAVPAAVFAQTAKPAPPQAVPAGLPLAFEASEGKTRGPVKFLARGPGYGLFLTSTDAVLALGSTTSSPDRASSLVRMTLLGANRAPQASGFDRLRATSNYIIGNDPAKWRTNVPTYGKVRYRDVYPGIDVVYYGTQDGEFEYDFIVSPGADASAIAFSFGEHALELDARGDIYVAAESGRLRLHAPVVYQDVNGTRKPVDGKFVVKDGQVSFALGAYDRTHALVIDPVLSYSTLLGGLTVTNGYDTVRKLTTDAQGHIYITGEAHSANFITTPGAAQPYFAGGHTDAFVMKINPNATGAASLVYSTYIGGSTDFDNPTFLHVNAAGEVTIAGLTYSKDLPTTANAYKSVPGGAACCGGDVFAIVLNAAGTQLKYSTYLGGSGTSDFNGDSLFTATVGANGDIYLAGLTNTSNFPIKNGFQAAAVPAPLGVGYIHDVFLARLNPNAATGPDSLVYSTLIAGNATEIPRAITVNGAGVVYLGGMSVSPTLPTTPDAYLPSVSNPFMNQYGFLAVVDTNAIGAASLKYLTFLDLGQVESLQHDAQGDIVFGGYAQLWDVPFPSVNAIPGASGATFVARLRPNVAGPAALQFSSRVAEWGYSTLFKIDAAGLVYVAGTTPSYDAFVVKVNPYASGAAALVHRTVLGGSSTEIVFDMAVAGNKVYITGQTTSTNFPEVNSTMGPIPGMCESFEAEPYKCSDAFVAKIDTALTAPASVEYAMVFGGSGNDYGQFVTADSGGNAIVTGATYPDASQVSPVLLPIVGGFQAGGAVNFLARFVPQQGNTPAGVNVPALPVDETTGTSPVAITFGNVTAPGDTTLETSTTWFPPPPSNFKLGTPPVYYDLDTTATFTGAVTVCINYTGHTFIFESTIRLRHLENGVWVDRTTSLNTTTNIICGSVTSFSPFVIVEPIVTAVPLVPSGGLTVFDRRLPLLPVIFVPMKNGHQTCQIPPAQLALVRTDGANPGPVAVSPAAFQDALCLYYYALKPKNLGVGTYEASILIDGFAVGKTTFRLR